MRNLEDFTRKSLSLVLICSFLLTTLSGCTSKPTVEIDTEAIANQITTEIQEENSAAMEARNLDWFAYQQVRGDYNLAYKTFPAVLMTSDGNEIAGFAYTDYASYFEADDGTGYFPAGFIAEIGENIPPDIIEEGLVIENLNYDEEQYRFVYAYETEQFMNHCVRNGQYIKYGVGEDRAIYWEAVPYERGNCDESLGALYSFDENRYVFDPDMGNYVPINGTSLFETIDHAELEAEINRIIEEQDINFSGQEIVSYAHTAQSAVENHFLSMQEEIFLGCEVSELVESASKLDPMQMIRITPEGYIVIDIDNNPPEGADAVAKWTVGICCSIVIIGSTALNVFTPAARPLSGAITGAAIDVFIQVVSQNQTVDNIQWNKVAVAAVSGALMAWACPLAASKTGATGAKLFDSAIIGKLCGYGVLTFSNAMVSGVTAYANTKIDGEEDGLRAFLIGATIGVASTAFAAVLAEVLSAAGPKISEVISRTKPGKWMTKAADGAATFIGDHQVHLKNQSLEDILSPKSISEAVECAMAEVHSQSFAGGGYRDLGSVGDGYEKHEMPAFFAYKEVSDLDGTMTRNQANLPAIKMSAEDHFKTASHGSSNEAAAYRAEQAHLIQDGKTQDAIQMDIDDLHAKFGKKYDDAIAKMIEHAISRGWWKA